MKSSPWAAALLLFAATADQALAQSGDVVRFGMIEDMSSLYSDITGMNAVAAAQMAAKDFGGSVLGRKIEILSADAANKPDIASSVAREWFERDGVEAILDVNSSAAALAVLDLAKQKNKVILFSGPGTSSLTNENCSEVSVHYVYDNYALARGIAGSMTSQGFKSWFFIVADTAFGHDLLATASRAIAANGGQIVGSVNAPLSTTDFASSLLLAQSSKAQVIGLANAGGNLVASLKQAREFGIVQGGQGMVGFTVYINDIKGMGLDIAQGTRIVNAFYWDRDENTRAWAKRFFDITGKMPNQVQAGIYSATLHYLQAVQATGSLDTKQVMAKMKEQPINDAFASNGRIREDGRMVHDMYLYEVKKPEESTGPWDLYKLVVTIPADQAFRPLAESVCPLVHKQ
jgi:branched-chain amino acid transport system substrate-binding protein